MQIGVYKYSNPDRRHYFRGYIQKYDGRILKIKTCDVVRKLKSEALKDAKKLKKQYERRKN